MKGDLTEINKDPEGGVEKKWGFERTIPSKQCYPVLGSKFQNMGSPT